MSEFLENIKVRAQKGGRKKIIFPEGDDARVLEAAQRLKAEGLVEPILVYKKGADVVSMDAAGLTHVEVEDAAAVDIGKLLLSLRSHKVGTADELTRDMARELSHDPLMYGMYLLRTKKADGLVAGAVYTTREVLRAALWLIGTAPGIKTISSSFYMVVPSFRLPAQAGGGEKEEVLTFADCGVVPNPSSEQLADIAIAAADARAFVVGDESRVAFLSYSTKGSGGDGKSIKRIRHAIEIVQTKRSDIKIARNELQGDAALIASVAKRKAPDDEVAGNANVLVFPDLNSANIAYKLVERLVLGAKAIGPVLHGLPPEAVVHDLSRGASADDIVNSALIAAVRKKA